MPNTQCPAAPATCGGRQICLWGH